MAKQRRKVRPEILNREFRIDSIQATVSLHVDKIRGLPRRRDTRAWLQLRGKVDEAVLGVNQFLVSLHSEGKDEPAPPEPTSIGAIIQLRPSVQAVIGLDSVSFDRVWSLASAGQLSYCWLAFTEPRRRSALILSVSFSNESDDQDSQEAPEPDAPLVGTDTR